MYRVARSPYRRGNPVDRGLEDCPWNQGVRELWERLCFLPHRGSAGPFERLAARLLKERLEGLGHTVQTQPFKGPQSYGPELILTSLLLGWGGLLALWWLALLGAYAFWAHFSGWWTPWGRLFDRYSSQNLVAFAEGSGPRVLGSGERREAESEKTGSVSHSPQLSAPRARSPKPRTLVLLAHYDSAKSFFLYGPAFVRQFRLNFLFNTAFATILPFACFLRAVPQLIGVYFLAQGGLLLWRELKEPYVGGANDNASGVAVTTQLFHELVLEPLPGFRPLLALTGCEEVGAKGAEHLARSGLVPSDGLVLNLDNVGRGELFYATGEGMLVFHPYRGELLELAKTTSGARPLEYRLAYFDTRPFAARGNRCLTLIRLEGGLPPISTGPPTGPTTWTEPQWRPPSHMPAAWYGSWGSSNS